MENRRDLRKSDHRDLINEFKRRHPKLGKAVDAKWVKDDPDRGPVYAMVDTAKQVLAYGWFRASGVPGYSQQLR